MEFPFPKPEIRRRDRQTNTIHSSGVAFEEEGTYGWILLSAYVGTVGVFVYVGDDDEEEEEEEGAKLGKTANE